MSYSAPNLLLMPMRHSIDVLANSGIPSYEASTSATAWPSANLAIYVPIVVPVRVTVVKLWCAAGSAGTGNVDMALFDSSGVAIISATNAVHISSGAGEQIFDTTDTAVGPGVYYLGLSSDSTTDTFYRYAPSAPLPLAYGVLDEASAYPLPSTATWAADQALAYIPVMGMYISSVPA